jgi:2'-5' RNA ligase
VRLFAGVELGESVRLACAEAARELNERLTRARSQLSVRWIPENNLHITLWFFGEVPDERAAEIAERLCAPWQIPSFEAGISGVGVFPPSGPIRIVWLGVDEGAAETTAIHHELTIRLAPLGFEPERRRYHPHVTIGRVRESRGSGVRTRTLLERGNIRAGTSEVNHITLFQSRLSPRGAQYEPRLRVPLKA